MTSYLGNGCCHLESSPMGAKNWLPQRGKATSRRFWGKFHCMALVGGTKDNWKNGLGRLASGRMMNISGSLKIAAADNTPPSVLIKKTGPLQDINSRVARSPAFRRNMPTLGPRTALLSEGAKDERVSIHNLGGSGSMLPRRNFEIWVSYRKFCKWTMFLWEFRRLEWVGS